MRTGLIWIGGLVTLAAAAVASAQAPSGSSAASASSPSGSSAASASSPGSSASMALTAPPSSHSAAAKTGARPSPYSAGVAKGHAAMAAHNYPQAIEAYRAASSADARDPLGLYFLGEAQVAAGQLDEADVTFGRALAAVGANDDVHARLLFGLAELREQQGKWLDAKRAWEAYGEFASSHPNAKSYATTAAERAKAIGVHVDLETKYAPVKQRAEQRAKEAAPLASSAPASSVAPVGSARVEAPASGSSSERAPASEGAAKKK